MHAQYIVKVAMKCEASTSGLRLYYYYQQPSYLMPQTQTNPELAMHQNFMTQRDAHGQLHS
jgi:hypothetical protein